MLSGTSPGEHCAPARTISTDSPDYEQLSYVGDTRIEALVSLYVSGDDRIMRKSIEALWNVILNPALTTI